MGEGGIQMVVPSPNLHHEHAQTVHLSKVTLRSLNWTIRKCEKEQKKGRLFFVDSTHGQSKHMRPRGLAKQGQALVSCAVNYGKGLQFETLWRVEETGKF